MDYTKPLRVISMIRILGALILLYPLIYWLMNSGLTQMQLLFEMWKVYLLSGFIVLMSFVVEYFLIK